MVNFPFPFSRTNVRAVLLVLCACILAPVQAASAFTPAIHGGESTRLDLSAPSTAHATSSGPSITRTIVGLLIVIAVIWGLTWVLKRMKTGRATPARGAGLESLATLPLGTGRSVHLVRAGEDYLLLGSSEHGLVPIHRYTEQQARDAGLLDEREPPRPRLGGESQPRGHIEMPGQSRDLIDRLREWTVRR